ncbi:hypothetical protein V5F49_19290 [Xanthobacter sp. V3C-3]|uniref:hypothetical protein n=1 Tax=Xanthobacter lutulentifluminis TaxID=3119935 RepID=UPI00372B25B6
MKFTSRLIDKKIMGVNIAAEISIGDYLSFAREILDKNEFQRRKVKTPGKTYDLLGRDLVDGCVMPPIILAVTGAYAPELEPLVAAAIANGVTDPSWSAIEAVVKRAVADKELLILDGLQRSLTMEGIASAKDGAYSPTEKATFLDHVIRMEIYVGLSKTGILYRMLTLNTGQTPMSFRHQLEILYYDYIDDETLPDGIKVFREVDDRRARGGGRYKYSDVVDLFYAFSTGTPMPFDKQALVGELREMRFLENYTYRRDSDEMRDLLVVYNRLVSRICELAQDWTYKSDDYEDPIIRPFASNIGAVFARPQSMAGFGAECKRLLNSRQICSLSDLDATIAKLHFSGEIETSLIGMLTVLDQTGLKAKRIGDAQRAYFQCAFRALLMPESETYSDLSKCWLRGQEIYEMSY